MSPPRSASANARTRAISVTACRPRGSSRTCSSVASRSAAHAEPRRRPRRSRPGVARTGVAFERARHAGVHDEHARARRAAGACSISSVRQSISSACPARPYTDAIWSWMPHGTPVATCSARCAASARSRRREREAGGVAQRERDRDLERRARRQAGADRYVDVIVEVGADRRAAEVGEHARDAGDRAAPRGLHRAGFVGPVGRDVDDAVELARARDDRARRSRGVARRRRRRGRSPSRRPSPRGSRPARRSG